MAIDDHSAGTTLVIFGATGDLTSRKLVPALLRQQARGRIPGELRIVGVGRREYSSDAFGDQLLAAMQRLAGFSPPEDLWGEFRSKIFYLRADLGVPADYVSLAEGLERIDAGRRNRVYYLATAPSYFPQIIENLGARSLTGEGEHFRRVVVEKPFGHDLESALALNQRLHAVFHEHQIFRIDHYLGKETAQNILFFRFLNAIFEPLWNRNYIDHVQITVGEEVDVGHRAGYYDQAGVLRDMFQNHLLQLLALVAMEPPDRFEAEPVRNEKVKVLRGVRPMMTSDCVRAQYEGFCEAPGVAEHSQTPTFAALKLYIDNWRWQGVPFYLRSGKALQTKVSEIIIEFKSPPHVMFDLPPDYRLTPNYLSLCIQPDEGIHLRFETKVPGSASELRSVDMDFHYRDSFGAEELPDAYERLLLDVLKGDASLFTRSDEIEAAWRLIDPLIQSLEREGGSAIASYPVGSWGPPAADALLTSAGRQWRLGCSAGHQ